jgi:type IV pilus assembly protein PilX
MITQRYGVRINQRGVVLVSSLLLLLVVTIMALSMFRSFGIQEKIAGNMREKQRALQAAESAEVYAEQWLIANSATVPVVCNGPLNANLGQGLICSNQLPPLSVATVPWQIGNANVVTSYTPTGMHVGTAGVSNPNSYSSAPGFYIWFMGTSADASVPGAVFQVDAVGYGGNANTAAVVESTFAVYSSSSNRGGP